MDVISIIVPVYNTEKYLEACLDSLIAQTYENIEIICVNDGSTDRSGAILERYKEKDKRITVITQVNKGSSEARNRGLSCASGKYIYFIDSDDLLEKRALEYLYCEAETDQLDVLYFDAEAVFESPELEKKHSIYTTYYTRKGGYGRVCSGEELFVHMIGNKEYRTSACLQLIKRDLLVSRRIRFYPRMLHEDNLFTTEVMLAAKRVSHRARPLYIRRVREDSIMTISKSFNHLYGYLKVVMGLARLGEENVRRQETMSALNGFLKSIERQTISIADNVYGSNRLFKEDMERMTNVEKTTLFRIIMGEGDLDARAVYRIGEVSPDTGVSLPVDGSVFFDDLIALLCFNRSVNEKIRKMKSEILVCAKNEKRLNEQVRQSEEREEWLKKQIEDKAVLLRKGGEEQKALGERYEMLRYDFEQMRNSVSFRVGRGLTYIPRIFRDVLQKK